MGMFKQCLEFSHSKHIASLSFLPNHTLYTAGDFGLCVWQYDRTTQMTSSTILDHHPVRSMALSLRGDRLACFDDKLATLTAWCLSSGRQLIKINPVYLQSFGFSPDAKHLLSIAHDHCTLWDFQTSEPIWQLDARCSQRFSWDHQSVFIPLISRPDQTSADGFDLWQVDIKTGSKIRNITQGGHDVSSLSMSTTCEDLLCLDSYTLRRLQISNSTTTCLWQKSFKQLPFSLTDAQLTPDQQYIVCANAYQGQLALLDASTGDLIGHEQVSKGIFRPYIMRVSPCSSFVLLAAQNNLIGFSLF